MGWSNCGNDTGGRPIGYQFDAVCDHVGCTKIINRGLAHACGGIHGPSECSCDEYFCDEHLLMVKNKDGQTIQLCVDCASKKG